MAGKRPRANLKITEAARQRRVGAAAERLVRIEWRIKEVSQTVSIAMRERVKLATDFVKDRVVQNISRPVTKMKGTVGREKSTGRFTKASRTRVSNRSKKGEFPKADTVQLLRSIFGVVKQSSRGVYDGYIGTPLHYGLILETKMDRSFLKRTLLEERSKVIKILSGPIK